MLRQPNRSVWSRAWDGWIRFSEAMRRVVAAIVFGVFYLTAGLVFFVVSRAFTRDQSMNTSFWQSRTPRPVSAEFFRRMS